MPTIFFQTTPDITIAADIFGDPKNEPILLLHGGGQTRHSWKKTGQKLAATGWYVIATDARGHGESSWSKKLAYNFSHLTDDLVAIINSLDKKPILIGASMGGICSIMALSRQPDLAKALILVDVSPDMEKKGVDRIFNFMSAKPDGYATIQEVQDAVTAYLPQRKNRGTLKGLKKNLRKLPNGNWGWHWDPKMLEVWRNNTHISNPHQINEFLYDVLANLQIPALLVRGAMSDVVSKTTVAKLLKIAPQLQYVDVQDAGHMVAGDSNAVFTNALLEFLEDGGWRIEN